jgi:hypothetical protein
VVLLANALSFWAKKGTKKGPPMPTNTQLHTHADK